MNPLCLVVADATRARIFTYQHSQEPDGPHEELRELTDLVDPARRKRASELFSDGSGGNHVGTRTTPVDDHRAAHLDELDLAFAKEIAAATTRAVTEHGAPKLVVIASSRMLGLLRDDLAPLRRKVEITDFQRDYTKLPIAELRERLVDLDVLPPRVRATT